MAEFPEGLERRLLDRSPEALFALDPDGRVVIWNWGCKLLFGIDEEQAVGRKFVELLGETNGIRDLQDVVDEALATGSAVHDLDLEVDGHNPSTVRFIARTIPEPNGRTEGLAVTARDRSEIQHLERQLFHQLWTLTESERRLRNLVPDAVVLFDKEGRISLANERTQSLFGHAPDDLTGRPVETLVPEIFTKEHGAPRDEVFERPMVLPRNGDKDLYGVRKDGREFPVEISLGPVQRGEQTMVAAAMRDISERLEGQRRLAELERLKEMDRFKARFINTAAHELKTPLTSMNIQLHLLSDPRSGELSAAQERHLEILKRTTQKFDRLVEDLLNAARLQADRMGLQREPLDVDRVVDRAVESMRDVAKDAGLKLRFDGGGPLRVSADPGRLDQVLFNLLNNAVKFTPSGGRVSVRTREQEGHAEVSVQDTGIGLEEHQIERLFRPFSQIRTSGKAQKGTGLGLYLSKGIVELHGGKIWVESEGAGKGSTFVFTLPLLDPAAQDRKEIREAVPGPHSSR